MLASSASRTSLPPSLSRFIPPLRYSLHLRVPVPIRIQAGSGRANPFGLHDVHGNVFEWCRERYTGYEFPTDPRSGERLGPPTTPDRCCRGGSFSYPHNLARAAMRMRSPESTRLFSHGVRLARELPPAAAK